MKRLTLLALFLVGCGEAPATDGANYDVKIGAETSPVCSGSMQLDVNEGTWACWPYYAGRVVADRTSPGMLLLNLELKNGTWGQVTAPATGGNIEGVLITSDGGTGFVRRPFSAALK